MPKVDRENIDSMNAMLTLTIPRQEIEPKIKSELNKFKQKAHLKGFRKGKAPLGFVKKMYGQSIMANVVNDAVEQGLTSYITDEKVEILGQPLPTEGHQVDLNINGKEDLTFKFDIGLAPDFEVQGVDSNTVVEKYAVQIPEEMIDEDMMAGRKRLGDRESVEDEIQSGDLISINAEEMENDELKADGWATTFTVAYDDVPEGATKDELSTLKKGDKLVFDITTIEGEKEPEYIRKYLLNVTEGDADVEIGTEFEGTINEVTRAKAAELNQEFYDKYFGVGKVSSEQEARELIEQDLVKFYDQQAESLLYRDLQEMLMDKNAVNLPDSFLKRWLMVSSENNTLEVIERDYDRFSKNLQWTLIRSKLAQKYKLEVSNEEVLGQIRGMIIRYYGMYMDESMVNNMVQRIASDRNEYEKAYEDLLADKVFKAVQGDIQVMDNPIDKEAFEQVIKEAQEKVAAAQLADEIGEDSFGEEE